MSAERLPKDPIDRTMSLLRNSLPRARKPLPRMPPEAVADVMEARNLRAETYASMEDMTDQCRSLAETFDETGIVVDLVAPEDDDSLVHHIDTLKATGTNGSR